MLNKNNNTGFCYYWFDCIIHCYGISCNTCH
nr:MAG TPA: hypothetical protein [Caudoviricetes sp.]DAT07189.1 MAG TPA: hypothetical protein [Caudoviricetes sp.]